jgi:GxxExxY protein
MIDTEGMQQDAELVEEPLTRSIIGAFYGVYRTLGFGFLETVYMAALERELLARNHRVGREVNVRVMYHGEQICTQRVDMVVDEKVIVETKSTYLLHPAAQRQLYNYLRATNIEIGLLLHFGREPAFYRLFCRKRQRSPPRDLEDQDLPAPERLERHVVLDPSV